MNYKKEGNKIIKKEKRINKLEYASIPRISKEEKYDFYKAAYMQIPCTLLTNENLEILESHCIMACRYNSGRLKREHEITLELLKKYKEQIQELEKKENIINNIQQNIIEKINYFEQQIKIARFHNDKEKEDFYYDLTRHFIKLLNNFERKSKYESKS